MIAKDKCKFIFSAVSLSKNIETACGGALHFQCEVCVLNDHWYNLPGNNGKICIRLHNPQKALNIVNRFLKKLTKEELLEHLL